MFLKFLYPFFTKTGGLWYHLRPKEDWTSHKTGVEQFLKNWNPQQTELLLIAPSGGYSLPKKFLRQFDQINIVEPDWIGRVIIALRFRTEFQKRKPKYFSKKIDFNDDAILDQFLIGKDSNKIAILFCNVLGQITITDMDKLKKNFNSLSSKFNWASYHDLYSHLPIKNQTRIINEHQTKELFADLNHLKRFSWNWTIAKDRVHEIEGVFFEKFKSNEFDSI